ncbi:MAG: NuoI/complex I 23 kDa subunit family protein [Phycisphaerales bacterium]
MTIPAEDIVKLEAPKLGRADASFLPAVFKGVGVTLRHMFGNAGRDGKGSYQDRVLQYPEERREHYPVTEGGLEVSTFRGVHRLNKDEDGRVKCVACFMCSTACPANCIHIEAAESPWDDREKYPKKFDIDELRCIYCGMCEEACPVDAIELTQEYAIVGLTRNEMIFDKTKLLEVFDQTVGDKPM